MAISAIKWVSLGVATSVLAYANLPVSFYPIQRASEKVLAASKLKSLPVSEVSESIIAGELWKTNGAVIMAVRRPG